MLIQLNFNSGIPAYLQVVDQIKTAAASGSLQAGEALPTIRTLAGRLRINRNTVAKAYAELESQGLIVTSTGKGCFLTNNHSPLTREARLGRIAEEIDAVLVQAHHLQVDKEEFMNVVRERLALFGARTDGKSERLTKPAQPQ